MIFTACFFGAMGLFFSMMIRSMHLGLAKEDVSDDFDYEWLVRLYMGQSIFWGLAAALFLTAVFDLIGGK